MGQAILAAILWCTATLLVAQSKKPVLLQDSDGDGLSDHLEDELLQQFRPAWMIGKEDCSVKPAQFASGVTTPTAVADDGTIYGQAFPYRGHRDEAELHFYHLWRQDCGQMGHALDAEHVAVLVRSQQTEGDGKLEWRALYWYAAAHEDTVCDASQITRSTTIHAEDKGATVWVSPGKHASFLNEELCAYGCGGDRCAEMEQMKARDVVNVGELSRPVDGAVWLASSQWPLADKMRRSDFPEARVARMERLPETDVAWANPSKRPAQAVIYGGNSTVNGIAVGGRNTDTALVLANGNTARALGKAQRNTGNALSRSYKNVVKAVGGAATSTGKALGVSEEKTHTDKSTVP